MLLILLLNSGISMVCCYSPNRILRFSWFSLLFYGILSFYLFLSDSQMEFYDFKKKCNSVIELFEFNDFCYKSQMELKQNMLFRDSLLGI